MKTTMGKRGLAYLLTVVMVLSMLMTVPQLTIKGEAAAKKAVKSVKITNSHLEAKTLVLKKGRSYRLKVKVSVSGKASKKVTYKSSNKKVATVSSKGKIKAVKKGTAKITVTSVGKNSKGKKVSTTLTVKVGTPVTKLKLDKTKYTGEVGDTFTLKVSKYTPTKPTIKKVSFSSGKKSVVTVSSKGKVTLRGKGTATITVKATDGSGKKATCKVTVKEKPQDPTTEPADPPTEPTEPETPTTEPTKPEEPTMPEQPALEPDTGKVLNIYCWNEEFLTRVKDHYPDYEKIDAMTGKIGDVEVRWNITPTTNNGYLNGLDGDLLNQSDAAADDKIDLFLVEADYALKYVDSDYTMAVSDLGITNEDLAQQYQYTKDVVTDSNGVLKALTWQACPSVMFYNRDVALEVLGTEDPAEVQKYVKDWDTFNATAATMKEKGYNMVSSVYDTYRTYYNNATSEWVDENGEVHIDDNLMAWAEDSKALVEAGAAGTHGLWSAEWNAGFYPEGKVFAYFGAAWFINFCSLGNQEGSIANKGRWGATEGPQSAYWGGTWICAATGTDNKNLIKDIMLKLTCDEDVMKGIVEQDDDFVNNKAVMDELAKSDYSSKILGGQNPLSVYSNNAAAVDMSNITLDDQKCNEAFQEAMKSYINGSATKDEALVIFEKLLKKPFDSVSSYLYYDENGQVQPSALVIKGTTILKEETDYTLELMQDKKTSEYMLIVTGINEYKDFAEMSSTSIAYETEDGWKYTVDEYGMASIVSYNGNATEVTVPDCVGAGNECYVCNINTGTFMGLENITSINVGYNRIYDNIIINCPSLAQLTTNYTGYSNVQNLIMGDVAEDFNITAPVDLFFKDQNGSISVADYCKANGYNFTVGEASPEQSPEIDSEEFDYVSIYLYYDEKNDVQASVLVVDDMEVLEKDTDYTYEIIKDEEIDEYIVDIKGLNAYTNKSIRIGSGTVHTIHETEDGWTYIVDEDGYAAIVSYTGNATEVIVPDYLGEESEYYINEICSGTFMGLENLTTIHAGQKWIYDNIIINCPNLSQFTTNCTGDCEVQNLIIGDVAEEFNITAPTDLCFYDENYATISVEKYCEAMGYKYTDGYIYGKTADGWSYKINGSSVTLISYTREATEVEVPDYIEHEGKQLYVGKVTENAFTNLPNLETIILPEYVNLSSPIVKECTALKDIIVYNNYLYWEFALTDNPNEDITLHAYSSAVWEEYDEENDEYIESTVAEYCKKYGYSYEALQ